MKRIRPGMPPLFVQVAVAERQLRAHDQAQLVERLAESVCLPMIGRLKILLAYLFGEETPHLDHEPALRTRIYNPRIKNIADRYTPNGHDPDCLIWRTKHDHHIKTNVKGDGAQFPDRVLINRERKRDRKARPKPKKPIPQRSQWPKGRKLQSRSTWPARNHK